MLGHLALPRGTGAGSKAHPPLRGGWGVGGPGLHSSPGLRCQLSPQTLPGVPSSACASVPIPPMTTAPSPPWEFVLLGSGAPHASAAWHPTQASSGLGDTGLDPGTLGPPAPSDPPSPLCTQQLGTFSNCRSNHVCLSPVCPPVCSPPRPSLLQPQRPDPGDRPPPTLQLRTLSCSTALWVPGSETAHAHARP